MYIYMLCTTIFKHNPFFTKVSVRIVILYSLVGSCCEWVRLVGLPSEDTTVVILAIVATLVSAPVAVKRFQHASVNNIHCLWPTSFGLEGTLSARQGLLVHNMALRVDYDAHDPSYTSPNIMTGVTKWGQGHAVLTLVESHSAETLY